jgi:cytochrome c
VLAVFFNGTPAGRYFVGTMPAISATGNAGSTPLQYLEVPEVDVRYANEHQCLSDPSPVLGYMTLQQMLENVKRDFAGIADGTIVATTTDTTPPVTTPVLPSPTGLNGWYLGPTVLNFTALDDLSGVVRTEVSRNNETTWKQLPCDGIALNDDGVHTVFYSSIDLAGNPEATRSITVKIDSIAPVTTVNYQHLISDHLISFVATDNLSGVARTEYKLDGSPWIKGTSLVFTSGGLHTILFRSIDVAGNVEKTNSITLNVRLKPPPIQPR